MGQEGVDIPLLATPTYAMDPATSTVYSIQWGTDRLNGTSSYGDWYKCKYRASIYALPEPSPLSLVMRAREPRPQKQ